VSYDFLCRENLGEAVLNGMEVTGQIGPMGRFEMEGTLGPLAARAPALANKGILCGRRVGDRAWEVCRKVRECLNVHTLWQA
jgi:hypothetical protein